MNSDHEIEFNYYLIYVEKSWLTINSHDNFEIPHCHLLYSDTDENSGLVVDLVTDKLSRNAHIVILLEFQLDWYMRTIPLHCVWSNGLMRARRFYNHVPKVSPLIYITLVLFLVSLAINPVKAVDFKSKELPTIRDPDLSVELVFQGDFDLTANQLSPVTAMTFLGKDILILSKNDGTVNRITNGALVDAPLLDVQVANKRERGLLGITSSKANDTNKQYIFLYFTESGKTDGTDICLTTYSCQPGSEPVGNQLYRYELYDNKLENPKLLLHLPAWPAPSHNGGAITVGPDNNLYLTIGDLVGSVNESSRTKAQNFNNGTEPDARAGILRITQNGKPGSESVLGNAYPLNLYYAYGIRNSFGIDFDPITGNLWDSENGPEYGDEINLVKPGFNSGWMNVQGIWKAIQRPIEGEDLVAGNISSSPSDLVNFGGKGKYSPPEFIWKETVGPTALKFLSSDKLGKHYANDLFVGSFNLGTIFHFSLNEDRTELSLKGSLKDKIADNHKEIEEIIFGEGFNRIADLEVGPDGYLYVLSVEGATAKIHKIMPKEN